MVREREGIGKKKGREEKEHLPRSRFSSGYATDYTNN